MCFVPAEAPLQTVINDYLRTRKLCLSDWEARPLLSPTISGDERAVVAAAANT